MATYTDQKLVTLANEPGLQYLFCDDWLIFACNPAGYVFTANTESWPSWLDQPMASEQQPYALERFILPIALANFQDLNWQPAEFPGGHLHVKDLPTAGRQPGSLQPADELKDAIVNKMIDRALIDDKEKPEVYEALDDLLDGKPAVSGSADLEYQEPWHDPGDFVTAEQAMALAEKAAAPALSPGLIAAIVYKIRARGLITEDRKIELVDALTDLVADLAAGSVYETHHYNQPVENMILSSLNRKGLISLEPAQEPENQPLDKTIAIKGAIAALTQNKTYQADIDAAVKWLKAALDQEPATVQCSDCGQWKNPTEFKPGWPACNQCLADQEPGIDIDPDLGW